MGSVDRLWAPWRHEFVSRRAPARCIFCRAIRSRKDAAMYLIQRGRRVFALLNRYPYNPGHLMVAPTRHLSVLEQLTARESSELLGMTADMVRLLRRVLRPQGFNVGFNLGRAAGAGILGHLHLHVVPRWLGDTNFMPVIAGTKVLPESLESLYRRLQRTREGDP